MHYTNLFSIVIGTYFRLRKSNDARVTLCIDGLAMQLCMHVHTLVSFVTVSLVILKRRLKQATWQRAVFFATSALLVTSEWPESEGETFLGAVVVAHSKPPRTRENDARKTTRGTTVNSEDMLKRRTIQCTRYRSTMRLIFARAFHISGWAQGRGSRSGVELCEHGFTQLRKRCVITFFH